MKTKICTKCDKERLIFEFGKDKKTKDGLSCICKPCSRDYNVGYYKKYPWRRTLKAIKQRCNNSKCEDYKNYGGRGIKCLITEEELKFLWFRDKAYYLKLPSIDRKDNDGDYTFDNCRYIEKGLNSIERNIRHIKPVLQFDLHDNFIKEWKSATEASKKLGIANSHIGACCLGNKNYSHAGRFKWKFKNE